MSKATIYPSPAKVNLFLNVLGKRDDGFHNLESIFLKVPVYDFLHVDTSHSPFSFSCNDPKIPSDESNLVVKAAQLFFEETGLEKKGQLRLEKELPSEAGMGGGSGNAAITLFALNKHFGCPLQKEKLHELAANLGSDVPFFLMGPQALGTGRGEILTDLPQFCQINEAWMVIAKPDFGVPTGWAFSSLKEQGELARMKPGAAEKIAKELVDSPRSWPKPESFFNSFERPVFQKFPILAWLKKTFLENGAKLALLSGSGSAVFGLFDNVLSAEKALNILEADAGESTWKKLIKMSYDSLSVL